MSALDEHCKGTLERFQLQNAIFNHYTGLNKSFVAENIKKSKRLFSNVGETRKERKYFRKFMNEGSLQ